MTGVVGGSRRRFLFDRGVARLMSLVRTDLISARYRPCGRPVRNDRLLSGSVSKAADREDNVKYTDHTGVWSNIPPSVETRKIRLRGSINVASWDCDAGHRQK